MSSTNQNKNITNDPLIISWTENVALGKEAAAAQIKTARWRSEAGLPPPKRVQVVDDTMSADAAYRLACEGTALLWQGDFQNARQLLQAMARRLDGKAKKAKKAPHNPAATSLAEAFHLKRMAQAQRSRTLGMLLVPVGADYQLSLRRAPDVAAACAAAYNSNAKKGSEGAEPFVLSLRELLGLIGAYEWRKKGVEIAALSGRIHPHYGVFSPIRGEYVALVAEVPLPLALRHNNVAFDIGTGTGVLAAVLAQRGVAKVIATDQDERALICARENVVQLGFSAQVELVQADLFPSQLTMRAALIVCNPPWLPARPSAPLEYAVYDPDSRMLKGFLAGVVAHLDPAGEAWLIISDLAEHLGLRSRDDLLALIATAGLRVLGRHDVRPTHAKVSDVDDPLHAARAAEVTSLWRLGVNVL